MSFFKRLLGPPEPWRKIPSDDKDSYLKYMNDFKPDKELQHIRIMLYGPTGSGKSSFINTMESALRGRITGQALPDGIGHGSFTKKYKTHKIKKGPGTHYPFVFTDLMGLERQGGVRVDDIVLALKGHVKEDYKFNPQTPLNSADPLYNSSPTLNDRTHVLVCVVPATTVSLLTQDFILKMRDVRLAARDLGIPQMAILTKPDEACREVQSDVKKVYTNKTIKQKMEELSAFLGIPLSYIFPVKNYHKEICRDNDIETLVLMALKQILNLGEDFVDNF